MVQHHLERKSPGPEAKVGTKYRYQSRQEGPSCIALDVGSIRSSTRSRKGSASKLGSNGHLYHCHELFIDPYALMRQPSFTHEVRVFRIYLFAFYEDLVQCFRDAQSNVILSRLPRYCTYPIHRFN